MSLASRLFERFRNRLTRWHQRETAEVGCKRVAWKRIASKLGVSVVSLYRARNGYGNFQLKAEHYVLVLAHSLKPKGRTIPTILTFEKAKEPVLVRR